MAKRDRYSQILVILVLPVFSLSACQAAGQGAPQAVASVPQQSTGSLTPQAGGPLTPQPVEVDLELGPGSLDFPDPTANLDKLSSFKATLVVSFDGARAGQATQWSNTSVLSYQKEPPARTLTFETTAQVQDPQPAFRAEMNGAAYELGAEGVCTATSLGPAKSDITYLNPSIALSGVLGAEEAGQETFNGIETDHYTFDERALAQGGLNESKGELWVASEGGYLVRYHLTTTGDESYFGAGIAGTYTWDYELSDINQVPPIELPEACPPGLVDAPLLEDAVNIVNMPGILQYETAASVADALAFYEQELPALGWAIPVPAEAQLPAGFEMEGVSPEEMQQALEMMQSMGLGQVPGQPSEPTATPDPNRALATYEQGSMELVFLATRGESSTTVLLVLRDAAS